MQLYISMFQSPYLSNNTNLPDRFWIFAGINHPSKSSPGMIFF